MSHVRTQIRQAAVAALATVGKVSASRTWPIPEEEIPLLIVTTDDEEIARGTLDSYARTLTLVVDAVAKGQFVDDDLDDLVAATETAINRSTLGGLCKPLTLASIAISIDRGAALIGRARMTYSCLYFTNPTNPSSAM